MGTKPNGKSTCFRQLAVELEKENYIKATHNGFKNKYGIFHTRIFEIKKELINITDKLNN